MISQDLINRGGSKLEITRALLESGLNIPIPESNWLYFGSDVSSLKYSFEKMKKPVIVRGSHPNDYHGFIDIIPTVRDVESWSQLEKAVSKIYSSMKSQEVITHCNDWNQPYSPEAHILLQEQKTDIVGSIMRHPHTGKIFVNYYDIEDRKQPRYARSVCSEAIFHQNLNECSGELYYHISNVDLPGGIKISDQQIIKAFELYLQIEKSDILDSSYAQQVEFGLNPLMFFQARPFKKFEPVADFKIIASSLIEVLEKNQISFFKSDDSFGKTPIDGVGLKTVIANEERLENFNAINDEDYCLISTQSPDPLKSLRANQVLKNLFCYNSFSRSNSFLLHKDYRFFKKSKVSLVGFDDEYKFVGGVRHLGLEAEMCVSIVYSDGERGIIVPGYAGNIVSDFIKER